jgi:hypothetical protein
MNDKENRSNNDEKLGKAFELTPEEKRALETLPRERMPHAALEDRVVGALRNGGVLAPPRRRVIELTAWRIAAAAAAVLMLLTGGFTLGQRVGASRAAARDLVSPELSGLSTAATLQHAGSEYVLALQRFTELPDSLDGNQAVQGREVALKTLYTVADQVARLVPKNELAKQLLVAINTDATALSSGNGGKTVIDAKTVIDF